jgi:hypothetical protein
MNRYILAAVSHSVVAATALISMQVITRSLPLHANESASSRLAACSPASDGVGIVNVIQARLV